MAEGKKPLQFLTNREFLALGLKERADYLMRAAHELGTIQTTLREQMRWLTQDYESLSQRS